MSGKLLERETIEWKKGRRTPGHWQKLSGLAACASAKMPGWHE